MAQLLVLRHGQTAYNRERRMQGQLDVPLDSEGRRQAEGAARSLQQQGISRVVSSDLSRAWATAATVAASLGLAVRVDARLREQHYGAWQGLTLEEIAATGQDAPPGGEPLAHVADRAVAAVRDHLTPEGTLLVVTHGDTARALTGRLLGLPVEEWHRLPTLGNAESLRLATDGGTWHMSRAKPRTGESIPA